MLNFRSYNDLNITINDNLSKIPKDIDLIVGIPRSGLLVANLISLSLNKPLLNLEEFLEKKESNGGERVKKYKKKFSQIKKVLVVDDSLNTGSALQKAKEKIKAAGIRKKIIYLVAYLKPGEEEKTNIYLEHCSMPRVFEWNIFHHNILTKSCVDIDGILCRDPMEEENDDGEKYLNFIKNIEAKIVPTIKISTLVTCRLEKYRRATEDWLKKNKIEYDKLVMMPYKTKEERMKYGNYGEFKAEEYLKSKNELFIESEKKQAEKIFSITKKDVYSFSESKMFSLQNPKIEEKIDIILPTYNRANKIKTAIQSIIDQTYSNWVLHIINDGGENVSKIINEFNDKRIKYYNIKHTGKPGALNYGLKHSHNPYIAYMDDDDIVFPQHLELLLTAALENKKNFVYSDTYLTHINEKTGKQISQTVENDLDVTYEMLRFCNYINHKQILHTRKLYEKVGYYDEKLHILIDWDYIKRLAKESEPYHIKVITGNHFLYITKKQINSITGLWTKNPQKVGDSLSTIFAKDSLAMIDLFQKYHQYTNLELQKQDLVQKNNQLELNIANLCQKIDQLESTINELYQKNDKLKADLDKIQSSKTYKLWQKYNNILKIFKIKNHINDIEKDKSPQMLRPKKKSEDEYIDLLSIELDNKKYEVIQIQKDIDKIMNSKFYKIWQNFNKFCKKINIK